MGGLGRLRVLLAMAWRNLFSAKGKNTIVGLIMVMGTFLVVLGSALLDSIERSMTESVTNSVSGHLQVYDEDARDALDLFGGAMMSSPDIGHIRDFGAAREALEKVDNVKAVVPMGSDMAEFYSATEMDHAIERIRKAVTAGDAARTEDAIARVRSMLELMRKEFETRRRLTTNLKESDEALGHIDRARSDAFWAELQTAPDATFEFLDTRIAPLVDENEGYFLQYLGTDVQQFARHFRQFELASGQMLPAGHRGLLVNQKFYDDYLRNRVARDLDKIREAIEEKGKRIADDPVLRNHVERMARQYRRVTFQLEPDDAAALAAKLSELMPGAEGNIDELVQQLLRVTDDNFQERYRFFFDEVVPRIRLYLFDVGDVITIRAFTKSGYVKSVNIKVWGTFRFKGLEKSALAGAFSLLDMVTFRDLHGIMTAERRKELEGIRRSVGLADVGRDDAEAALFGGGTAVETQAEAGTGFDEFAGVELGRPKKAAEADTYDPGEVDRGMALHAALVLADPGRIEETQAAVGAAIAAAGLPLQVVDWQQASGIVGQLVVLVRVVLYVAIAIIFLVALVIINNTMIMATMERAMEIGTMRAIGAQARLVLLLFLLETVILGLVAGVFGAGLGVAFVGHVGQAGIAAMSDELVFLFSGPRLYPSVGAGHFLSGLGVIVLVSLLATFYPAFVATRIEPVVAMQPRE